MMNYDCNEGGWNKWNAPPAICSPPPTPTPMPMPLDVSQQRSPHAIVGNGGSGCGVSGTRDLHEQLVETMVSLKDLAPTFKLARRESQAALAYMKVQTETMGKLSVKLDAHETRLDQQQKQVENHEVRIQKLETSIEQRHAPEPSRDRVAGPGWWAGARSPAPRGV